MGKEGVLKAVFLRVFRGCGSLGLACAASGLAAQTAPALPAVTVIATLPLPGLMQPLNETASAIQAANAADLARSQALDLSHFMQEQLGGVYVNEVQGNPFQMDVNYRGYTASPLLGTPQGLSVYLDGVRMNQPFGDVVSWDLIPRSAIDSLTLMPGSNPLFGLNTLGGAVVLQSKSGLTSPGTSVQTTVGANQRRAVEMSHGGRNDQGLHWFATGNWFNDEGWRDASASRVRQSFGKLGWKDSTTDLSLSLSHADNRLNGTSLQEERMLANDYRSAYTKPDETRNRATWLNLTGKQMLSDSTVLAANAYYRQLRTWTFNGDLNWDALAAVDASGDPPGATGLLNRTGTDQSHRGFSGQLTWLQPLLGHDNQWTAGLAYDASRTEFAQTAQLGNVNPDRSVAAAGVDAEPNQQVSLHGNASTWSVFATNTLSWDERWHLTLSGRYNRTRVSNQDRLLPGGGSGSLDGDYVYQRLNPAVGLAFTISPALSAYAGYSESSRTPTSIELGCADPANPCKLPNAMAGDPPLKQVVTKSWEAGWRGALSEATQWTAGVFRTQSADDILFVAAPDATSYGYFKNFGKTLRQGIELGLKSQAGAWRYGAHYTWLQATYQSAETLGGSANSSSDASSPGLGGNIAIAPGDTLPLTPKQTLKLHADYQWSQAWATGVGLTAFGSLYARGNENNQHQANGVNYLGSGRTAGYAVVNLNTSYQPSRKTRWTLNILNLFNRRYVTAAQLGPTAFNANGSQLVARPDAAVGGEYPLQNSQFVAPGAPRGVWVSLRHSFD